MLCAMMSPLCVGAFAPSTSSSRCRPPFSLTRRDVASPAPTLRPHQALANARHPFTRSNNPRTPSSLSAAAAAASWLFTPDRTASALADATSDVLVSSAHAATDAALDAASAVADVAAAVTTETVVRTIYKAPFLSLAAAFVLGGLFFGTVAATVAAIVALGKENTRRLREVAGIVYRRIWSEMKIAMQLTMDVLRGKDQMSGFKNRFPAALQAFKEGVAEVRRVFSESVDAIKQETRMYSAAVGMPGLIPIQYIFDRIFPSTMTAPFQQSLEDALLQTAKENPQIRKIELKKFTMGDVAPKVTEARLFELGNRDMAFDLEINWDSNVRADLDMRVSSFGAKIPVTIQNLNFSGPVRLILVGLRPEEPGWEALLISLPRPPQIGFDIKVAGGLITQIPWLRKEFAKSLDKAVAEEVLWPQRAVVSAPSPYKAKPLLNPMQILSYMRDDPLLRKERELMKGLPDDFRATYEAQTQEDAPGAKVRDADAKNNDTDDGEGGDGTAPVPKRLRFWQRNKQAVTVEASAASAIQLMAETLQQEAGAVGERVGMPVMVLEGVQEKRSLPRRLINNFLLPKSMLSYVGREGGI